MEMTQFFDSFAIKGKSFNDDCTNCDAVHVLNQAEKSLFILTDVAQTSFFLYILKNNDILKCI